MSSASNLSSASDDSLPSPVYERTPLVGVVGRPATIAAPIAYTEVSVDRKARHDEEQRAASVEEAEAGARINSATTGLAGVISVLLLGVFVANADGPLVLASSGTISSELASLENQSWLIVSYSLAMCAVQSAYGKLSDIYGRKNILIVSYAFFATGCALCGLGVTMGQVVVGRIISGIGGAGMTALVSVLISDTVPLRDVATWRGYVNVVSTLGKSSGGPIGGFLTDTIGWRWSFFIQCPLAIIAIVLVSWKLKTPKKPFSFHGSESEKKKLSRVDFLGTVTLAVTITSFLTALDIGGQKVPWTHPLVWALFASSVVSGVVFLLVEEHIAHEPIFPLRLLVHRDVVTAYLVTCFQSAAQFALMYTVPLYFQITAQTSVTTAGAHLIPAVCSNAIGGVISGIIIKRTASYKPLILVSLTVSLMGYLLLIATWHGHTNVWESLYIAPGGFGTGVVGAVMFVCMAAGIDESQMAIASTGIYLSSNIGSLVGASLASNVLQTVLRTGLETGLQDFPDKETIMQGALTNLEYIQTLEGPARDIVVHSYVNGFEYSHLVSVVGSLLAFLVGLTMRVHDLG